MDDTKKDVDLGLQLKTVKDIQECIVELKEESRRNEGSPISDGNNVLNRFCSKLELLLQLGLKERFGKETGDYFSFLVESSRTNKNVGDGIKFVKHHKEYHTKLGQGRALVRYSLVHHLLADTLQHCVDNVKVINKYYSKSSSIFYNKQLSHDLVSDLYDLNDLTFDLEPLVHDLDIQWPTFSRSRRINSPVNSWRRISTGRSSIVSCASSFQDDNISVQFSCDRGNKNFLSEEIDEARLEGTFDEGKESVLRCSTPVFGGSNLDSEKEINNLETEIKIKELSNTLMKSEAQNSLQKSQLDVLLEQNRKLGADLESSEKSNEELRRLLDELRRQVDEETASGKNATERLAKENWENVGEIELLHEKIMKLETEKNIADEVIRTSLDEVGRMERSIDHLRLETEIQVDDARQNVLKLERDIGLFVDFLDRLQTVCLPECSPMAVIDPESGRVSESALDRAFVRLEAKIEAIHRGGAGEEGKSGSIGEKMEAMYGDLASKESENEKLNLRIRELEESVKSLEKQKSDLKDELEKRISEEESRSSMLKQQVEKLEEDLRRKEKETNETIAEVEEALISTERERNALSLRIEGAIAEKDSMVKELRDDMEVMIGSYKRREILMEETRRDFEKSIEKMQEEHLDEVASLKENIQQLESKICSELTLEKKHEFESEIGKLDEKLMTAKEDQLVAQLQFKDKLEEVNNKLESMEEENVSLRNQVSQLCRENKNERLAFREKEEVWTRQKVEHETRIHDLKSHFAQLLSDKRQLWEKCQELMDREGVTASYKWVESSSVTNCHLCNATFTLSIRKHHCRRCGNVFCANCSNNWIEAPHSSSKSRACNICTEQAVQEQTSNSTTAADDDSNERDDCNGILDVSRTSNDSFADHGEDSLLPPEACAPHIVINSSSGSLSTLARLTGGVKNVAVWATSTAVSSIVKTTGQVSGIFGKGVAQIESDAPVFYDDRFEIISPEEITESRMSLPSNDETIILEVIDPASDDDDSFELMEEIPSEKMLIVPINLKLDSNKATSIHWSFHSEPKGVTFGISYHGPYERPSTAEGSSGATGGSMMASFTSSMISSFSGSATTEAANPLGGQRKSEVLLPLKKVHSHLRNVSGSLTPKSAGVYAFLFDNTKSSLMTKKIFLKLKLIPRSSIALPPDC